MALRFPFFEFLARLFFYTLVLKIHWCCTYPTSSATSHFSFKRHSFWNNMKSQLQLRVWKWFSIQKDKVDYLFLCHNCTIFPCTQSLNKCTVILFGCSFSTTSRQSYSQVTLQTQHQRNIKIPSRKTKYDII